MSNFDPLIGKKLGDYTIQDLLGKGGMARVYRGYDITLDRFAAVKVIEPQLVSGQDDDEYRDRFVREARAIARLNHPRVVGIFQFGDIEKELYYMAMVFVEGNDLRQILKDHAVQNQRLSYAQVLKIVKDIGEALDYSHEQGVIHRDVKPSNIMVTKDGHAVLTDFGLALNTSEGTIGNTFGSVHYIAPEQAVSSAQAVAQSDLYSLGVVLYEMLVGRVPFEDMSAMSVALKHISDPPPEPSLINPKITPQIEEVVLKSLDKDPRRRYQTGTALVMALQSAFASSPDEDTEELDEATPLPSNISIPVIEKAKPDSKRPASLPKAQPPSYLADTKDDSPTVSDSSRNKLPVPSVASPVADTKSRQTRPKQEQSESSSRMGLYVLGGVMLLAIIAVGALLLSGALGGSGDDDTNGTQTAEAIIALNASATPIEELEATTTAEDESVVPGLTSDPSVTPVLTETPIPTDTQTDTPVPLATNTSLPSDTPLPTDTPTVTESPTVGTPTLMLTVSADAPQLILRYDGRTLIVYNRAPNNESIDISDLSFERVRQNGSAITFSADEWLDPNNRLTDMRPGVDCFQVWSTSFSELPIGEYPSDICTFRQGVMQTNRTFWVSSTENATFNVLLNGAVIATCASVPSNFQDEIYCEVELRDD